MRLLVALVVTTAASAHAQQATKALADARAFMQGLKFEAAVQRAGEGLAAGDASPTEVTELYFTLGQASGVLGRADEAVDAYARALELSPGLALPPGSSPKLADPWRDAVAKLGGARLSATPVAATVDDGRVRVTVEVHGDTLGLVETGVLDYRQANTDDWQTTQLTRTLPSQGWFSCTRTPCAYAVKLLDRRGNSLLEAGTRAAPLLVESVGVAAKPTLVPNEKPLVGIAPPAETVTAAPSREWYRSPSPYLLAAVACAAAGSLFAVKYASDEQVLNKVQMDKASYGYRDAQTADGLRHRDLGLSIAGFAATAAFAVTAIIVW